MFGLQLKGSPTNVGLLGKRKSQVDFKAKLLRIQKLVKKQTKIDIRTLVGLGRAGRNVPCLRTPWPEMDDWLTATESTKGALQVGTGRGLPQGRIVEIFGPESTAKTTLTLQLIAEFQRQGLICAFIDVEHAFDSKYAAKLGVDVTSLLFHQPDSAEEALNLVGVLSKSKLVALIVVDSVAALVPVDEVAGKSGKMQPGHQARLMSQACRKLAPTVSKTGTLVVFINQIRMKIGMMYGNPENTSGGNALKFYASIRIELRKIKIVKVGLKAVGTIIKARTAKNKIAEPFRELWLHLRFGKGIVRAEFPSKKKNGVFAG